MEKDLYLSMMGAYGDVYETMNLQGQIGSSPVQTTRSTNNTTAKNDSQVTPKNSTVAVKKNIATSQPNNVARSANAISNTVTGLKPMQPMKPINNNKMESHMEKDLYLSMMGAYNDVYVKENAFFDDLKRRFKDVKDNIAPPASRSNEPNVRSGNYRPDNKTLFGQRPGSTVTNTPAPAQLDRGTRGETMPSNPNFRGVGAKPKDKPKDKPRVKPEQSTSPGKDSKHRFWGSSPTMNPDPKEKPKEQQKPTPKVQPKAAPARDRMASASKSERMAAWAKANPTLANKEKTPNPLMSRFNPSSSSVLSMSGSASTSTSTPSSSLNTPKPRTFNAINPRMRSRMESMDNQKYHSMRDAYKSMYEAKVVVGKGPALQAAVVLPKPSVTKVNVEVNPQETKVGDVDQAYYTFPAGFDPTNREDVASKSKKVEYKAEEVEVTDEEFFDFMVENGITESVESAEAIFEHMSDEWFDSIYTGLIEAKNKEGKEQGLDGKACWKGYKRMGTKQKGGKTVDNCVKM